MAMAAMAKSNGVNGLAGINESVVININQYEIFVS
jgi:hypothetical protein